LAQTRKIKIPNIGTIVRRGLMSSQLHKSMRENYEKYGVEEVRHIFGWITLNLVYLTGRTLWTLLYLLDSITK
jgi:hypothetical protein